MAATLSPTTEGITVSLALPRDLAEVWQLLQEYFDAVHVVVRDEREAVARYLRNDQNAIWLAHINGHAAGCITLRPLGAMPSGDKKCGEIKRLYVRPNFRRLGIAGRLLSALEAHAEAIGLQNLYLDSKDDLPEALAFYERSGYQRCERYNDNPQATLFMRKSLSVPITVRDFCAGDEDAFWSLNEAWISKLFKLEPKDIATLRNPQVHILSTGGRIYMACRGVERIGCCALVNMGNGSFELAKMGVAESERGKGVGRALLEHVVNDARIRGVRRLYLETNHSLNNAIHLYESVGFRHLKAEEVTPSPYARADVFMEMDLA